MITTICDRDIIENTADDSSELQAEMAVSPMC